MSPVRDGWRARAADPGLAGRQREYALRRVGSLGRSYASRIEACNTRGCRVKCGCPDESVRVYSCRQHWTCSSCAQQRSAKNKPRIREGLEAAWKNETRGGWRKFIHMITLTVRHSGSPSEDREALANGWRALYKRMHREFFTQRRRPFPYVGVYEATPGRDGLGHVHIHIVMVAPFLSYAQLHEWWTEACPESSHVNIEPSQAPHEAARYLSKYVTKTAQGSGFSPVLRADICAAFYNKKCVFSSVRFFSPFHPFCTKCGCELERVGRSVFCGAASTRSGTGGSTDPPPDVGGDGKQVAIAYECTGAGRSHGIH